MGCEVPWRSASPHGKDGIRPDPAQAGSGIPEPNLAKPGLTGRRSLVFEDAMDETTPRAKPRRRTAAAERALAEAASRRAKIDAAVQAMPRERGRRSGPEPVRYGDWEVKGIASDFS